MIFKVFYQAKKERSPRRETTQTLYLDIDTDDAKAGIIKAREIVKDNTNYHVEFIDALSDEAVKYDQENGEFEVTKF